jgi:ABC-type dipeptide/oligopeptide/nickel transport system permease component
MLLSATFVPVNLVVDLLYVTLDPRSALVPRLRK